MIRQTFLRILPLSHQHFQYLHVVRRVLLEFMVEEVVTDGMRCYIPYHTSTAQLQLPTLAVVS